MNNRFVLLSFDVEEFDMPLDYQFPISTDEQLQVGFNGMEVVTPIIHQIPSTLFTTANYATHYPTQIQALAKQHEIASHTYFHSHFEIEHLLQSKQKLEDITGKEIFGLRMPRMKKVDMQAIKNAGYTFDSSIHPTWIPGKYNNLHLSRTYYYEESLLRIPASVSPTFRLPLFWLAFKNYPYTFFKKLAIQTLKKDSYLCLYFHPWEFVDITHLGVPAFTRKHCKEVLLIKLQQLIKDLQPHGDFTTMQDFIQIKKL
jgi:peptidoglycan/xylan/chitin deacetylase (PgdA/CDA1 family)